MKKKAILVLFLVLTISLIGVVCWYFKYQHNQIFNIKKEISELKIEREQQNQAIKNLIIFEWGIYQNSAFNFHFKHPNYVYICDNPYRGDSFAGVKLFLDIYIKETCDEAKRSKDPVGMRFIISNNKNNYKTAEEAFYKEFILEFPNLDKSLNTHLEYFKINGIDAFGGEIVNKTQGDWVARSNGYGAIILKNNYLVKISDIYYNVITGGDSIGSNKPITDVIVSSLYFDSVFPWK